MPAGVIVHAEPHKDKPVYLQKHLVVPRATCQEPQAQLCCCDTEQQQRGATDTTAHTCTIMPEPLGFFTTLGFGQFWFLHNSTDCLWNTKLTPHLQEVLLCNSRDELMHDRLIPGRWQEGGVAGWAGPSMWVGHSGTALLLPTDVSTCHSSEPHLPWRCLLSGCAPNLVKSTPRHPPHTHHMSPSPPPPTHIHTHIPPHTPVALVSQVCHKRFMQPRPVSTGLDGGQHLLQQLSRVAAHTQRLLHLLTAVCVTVQTVQAGGRAERQIQAFSVLSPPKEFDTTTQGECVVREACVETRH